MSSNKPYISAIINVRNESESLKKCLRSIKDFADEIIVVDMQSTDNSFQVAKEAGATVYPYRYLKVVEPARNFAISKAKGQWILILDPDEYLGRNLKKELKKQSLRSDINWIKIPRQNFIFGKWVRHSRTWPDYLIRFFKKGTVTWQDQIHSQPNVIGQGHTILDSEKLAIKHNNYPTVGHFLIRANRYSLIQASELQSQGYRLKLADLLLKPIQEFNSRFYFSEGFKDGTTGLVFCLLQSYAVALVYIRLWEKQSKGDKVLSKESFISASSEAMFEYNHWFTNYYIRQFTGRLFSKFVLRVRHLFFRLTKNL